MSKKFDRVALELAWVRPVARRGAAPGRLAWKRAVVAVANGLEASFPRFSDTRFIQACNNWRAGIRNGALVNLDVYERNEAKRERALARAQRKQESQVADGERRYAREVLGDDCPGSPA